MQGLVHAMMWRHRKAHVALEIALPPCEVSNDWITLSTMETTYYTSAYDECRRALQRKIRFGGAVAMDSEVMTLLLKLRQTCCHPQIVGHGHVALGTERLTMKEIMSKLMGEAQSKHRSEVRDLVAAQMKVAKAMLPDRTVVDLYRQYLADVQTLAAKAKGELGEEEWTKTRALYDPHPFRARANVSVRANVGMGARLGGGRLMATGVRCPVF